MNPLYDLDRELSRSYSAYVCGVDEAGRGCLAGPIVAGCVILDEGMVIDGIRDSKLLTPKRREELGGLIRERALAYGLGMVSEREIDGRGIEWANRMAFTLALQDLMERFPGFRGDRLIVLVDGKRLSPEVSFPLIHLVHGDRLSASVAAASILAKTHRDAYVCEVLHKAFPQFRFDKHKGYPTSLHIEAIRRWGLTPFHLRSFRLEA